MKHETNHHGAVDKSFAEQQIRIVDINYILCEKNGPIHIAEPGLTLTAGREVAGRQVADEIQVNLDFFKESLYNERFDFSLRLTKVQHHYSSRNAFQVFFRVKSILKLVFKVRKFMKPYDFLPIPTIT